MRYFFLLILLGCGLVSNAQQSGPIIIPGTATEVTTLLGTITIKCQNSGECGRIYVNRMMAEILQPDGAVHQYSYSRYDVAQSGSGTILTLYEAKRLK